MPVKNNKIDYSLCLVVGSENVKEGELCSSIEKAIVGGCTIVQLREKEASTRDFYYSALEVKKITDRYNIPFIINDRVDIALAVDADGIHVGQSDLPIEEVRKILGKDKIVGASASTIDEALEAASKGADYLGVGAMFPTDTKKNAIVTSIEELIEIRKSVSIPIIIIGGINQKTVPEFKNTNIDGLAVVSAILSEPDITKAATELKEMFHSL